MKPSEISQNLMKILLGSLAYVCNKIIKNPGKELTGVTVKKKTTPMKHSDDCNKINGVSHL